MSINWRQIADLWRDKNFKKAKQEILALDDWSAVCAAFHVALSTPNAAENQRLIGFWLKTETISEHEHFRAKAALRLWRNREYEGFRKKIGDMNKSLAVYTAFMVASTVRDDEKERDLLSFWIKRADPTVPK